MVSWRSLQNSIATSYCAGAISFRPCATFDAHFLATSALHEFARDSA